MSVQAPVPDPVLSFEMIAQRFGAPNGAPDVRVIDAISFEVGEGRFTSVIGPSGCGKSTLLQMAAGLLKPSGGRVRHHGRTVEGVNRDVGFVPQQAQLFPWKTLRCNVELPLVLRGVAPVERERRVTESLEAVGLTGFENYYPAQLSGGMQKRGSIARTLVYGPDVILMDEPFGALDAQTRMVMQDDLQALSMEAGASVLFVTHDITEAVLLSDNVVVLSQRPARVIANVPIDLARPRNVYEPYKNPGFEAAYETVWTAFQSQLGGLCRSA